MDYDYLQNLTPVAGMTPEQQRQLDSWKKSTDYRTNLKSVVDPMDAGLASQSYRSAVNSMDNNTGIASGYGVTGSTGTDATEPKSWWGEAADWAGNKNNQSLIGMGLGAANVGLGLANYLQSSDFMKKQGRLLDQQIANNTYEMGRRQGFSRALADAQNQTQAG